MSPFPSYKMKDVPPPTLEDILRVFGKLKDMGLRKLKVGNCGVIAKTEEDWRRLEEFVGKEGIG